MIAPGRRRDVGIMLLVPIAISQFLISLDFSCMALVLPVLAKTTGADPAALQWTISAAALTWGGCLVLGGRIADHFGHRRIFVVGLTIFGVGASICALAPSVHVILIGRALSGLGGALFAPAILAALIAGTSDGSERNRALAVYSVAQALGSALGVAFGGILAAQFGWRGIFGLDLAVALSALCAAAFIPAAKRKEGEKQPFDIAGAMLVTAGCALLVLAFSSAGKAGFVSREVIVPILAASALLAMFAWVEGRTAAPILPLSMLRVPGFVPALAVNIATNAAMAGLFYLLATFLHQIAGFGTDWVGTAFLAKIIGVIAAAMLVPALMQRLSPWTTMTLGCLATTAILLALTRISVETAIWATLLSVILLPVGQMMAVIATTAEATGRVPSHQRGVASAILLAGTQIGVAMAMGLYASALEPAAPGPTPDIAAGFATAAAIAGLGMLIAASSLRLRNRTAEHREDVERRLG